MSQSRYFPAFLFSVYVFFASSLLTAIISQRYLIISACVLAVCMSPFRAGCCNCFNGWMMQLLSLLPTKQLRVCVYFFQTEKDIEKGMSLNEAQAGCLHCRVGGCQAIAVCLFYFQRESLWVNITRLSLSHSTSKCFFLTYSTLKYRLHKSGKYELNLENLVVIITQQESSLKNVNGMVQLLTLVMKSKPSWRIYRVSFSRTQTMTLHACAEQTQTHTHTYVKPAVVTPCTYQPFLGTWPSRCVSLCVCASVRTHVGSNTQ